MRSVADDLRRDARVRDLARDPGARVAEALRIGAEDLHRLAVARGLEPGEARQLIARARALGRMPSVANGGSAT